MEKKTEKKNFIFFFLKKRNYFFRHGRLSTTSADCANPISTVPEGRELRALQDIEKTSNVWVFRLNPTQENIHIHAFYNSFITKFEFLCQQGITYHFINSRYLILDLGGYGLARECL